ncbi:MAG: hypothetical protein ACE5KV_00450, partial [Thermoplasmata archaeon]
DQLSFPKKARTRPMMMRTAPIMRERVDRSPSIGSESHHPSDIVFHLVPERDYSTPEKAAASKYYELRLGRTLWKDGYNEVPTVLSENHRLEAVNYTGVHIGEVIATKIDCLEYCKQ